MSIEGKVRALSKLLRDNLGFMLQGIVVVAPIFAMFDLEAGIPRVYFYDAMGAGFEAAEFSATGSGSSAVRALDTASEADAATDGVDRHAKIFPIVKLITKDGISTLPEARLAKLYHGNLSAS